VIVTPTAHQAPLNEQLLIDPDPPPKLDEWFQLPPSWAEVYIDRVEPAAEGDDVDCVMYAHEPGAKQRTPG
jgi:hypothetical protein